MRASPAGPFYKVAFAKAAELDGGATFASERIVAVGDAVRTDIAGARVAGIASILVARGIHAEELGLDAEHARVGDIAGWLARQPVYPDAVIERLIW